MKLPGINEILVIFLSSLVVAIQFLSAKEPPKRSASNPQIQRVESYVIPENHLSESNISDERKLRGSASLGETSPSASPGSVIGYTYYEYQHNSAPGRMIGTGQNISGADTNKYVHFTWMYNTSPSPGGRTGAYVNAGVGSGTISSEVFVSTPPGVAGYFNLDVTPDNQAIISGHYDPTGDPGSYAPTVWYDSIALAGDFSYVASIPEPHWQMANPWVGTDAAPTIWPHLAFQTTPSGSHVTHLTAATVGGSHIYYYYRKEGNTSVLSNGELSSCPMPAVSGWDCPWVFDTAWNTDALVIGSKQSGKVALVWTAHLPDYKVTPGCDTCSENSSLGPDRDDFESDVYFQISNNYGISWNPRQNVTHNYAATAAWMPYKDFDALWDKNDELHIAWVASDWQRFLLESNPGFKARIYHWTESYGNDITDSNSSTSRVAAAQNQEQILCNGNPNNLSLAKLQLSECNANLYCLFVDLWDGHFDPNYPDCSQRGYNGNPYGSVNGELMVSISDDNGLSWDLPHNLTNSPTPHCDSATGTVGSCDSDHWPSMPPHGFAVTSSDGSVNGVKIIPRQVSYPDGPGSEWLPVVYINDLDAGVPLFPADGSLARENPVRTFYMACVGPDQIGWGLDCFGLAPDIGWPTYAQPGEQLDIARILENSGTSPVSYTLEVVEDNGPPGWLVVSPISGSLGIGVMNKDTVTIQLNASAFPAGSSSSVFGRIILQELNYSTTCTVNVNMIVRDTIFDCSSDSISTGAVSLGLCCHLNFGTGCGPGMGNYLNTPLGCDTIDLVDSILYDGSLIVGSIVDGDTLLTNEFYMQPWGDETAIYRLTSKTSPTVSGILETWRSGILTNHDTTLGMEISYFAPQVTASYGPWHLDQQFITREFKVWSMDGQPHPGLVVGEVIDWNLPSESGNLNSFDTSGVLRLLYMRGSGAGQPECSDNDDYYAGMAFGYFKKFNAAAGFWSIVDSSGYGGFYGEVAPSFDGNELYRNMYQGQGYVVPQCQPYPGYFCPEDIYIGLTYAFNYDLQPNDTFTFYAVLATIPEDLAGPARIQQLAGRGHSFNRYWGCCRGIKGDLNGDGAECNIIDLNFLVNYVFRSGLAPTCKGEADVNSDRSPGDIVDMNFMVNRIFRGGAPPQNCGSAL
ncbi:MAG TPA: hypothetical protein VHP63_08045 [candidate division Zixibacteria bacterium]|nr:hypothetical protein [candidate division Zixibacteria bacterium]